MRLTALAPRSRQISPCLLALALAACESAPQPRAGVPGRVRLGIDVLQDKGFKELKGKAVGLITNHTGKDGAGRSTVEILSSAPGLALAAIFSPEHGFTGKSEESKVSSESLKVERRQVPMHSLYRGGIKGMRPEPRDLEDLDALVFDIQDIGARFYTYLATMGMALEEAKKANLEFIVLDRPNPVTGTLVEGPLLKDPALRQMTATAYFPVTVRHGMTAGEIARLHNAEIGHKKLKVVRLEGWSRGMWYDETGLPWTAPSPNMPDLESAALYPGIACLEFTNLSVGRGTPVPFRWIGAPWLDAEDLAKTMSAALLEGIEFSVQDYTPSKSAHAGEACRGLAMRITDRGLLRPLRVFAHLATALRDLHPNEFDLKWENTRKLVGSPKFKELYDAGAPARDIIRCFEAEAELFEKSRRPFLLYE